MSTWNRIRGFLDRLQVLPSKLLDTKTCQYKESEDSLIIYVDLPGLSKENVTISVDKSNNTLIVKGEGDKESLTKRFRRYVKREGDKESRIQRLRKYVKGQGDEESPTDNLWRYERKLELPKKTYKLDAIKAEMKNGVLELVIPKMENTVFPVNVE
ncbi:hypothetical protein POM88_015824 [Heracleum sosnowskyi]|uniref:SHSP domain-containing protein n=1 Tax=Heracleum sosnowskyi TaxID=360622 RepID=A0AAD8MW91_9APIA|nr:hypothetical protein POM88_015824 [Heracleum sosnowskyi]